jgi:predicted transcriptional regulator
MSKPRRQYYTIGFKKPIYDAVKGLATKRAQDISYVAEELVRAELKRRRIQVADHALESARPE